MTLSTTGADAYLDYILDPPQKSIFRLCREMNERKILLKMPEGDITSSQRRAGVWFSNMLQVLKHCKRCMVSARNDFEVVAADHRGSGTNGFCVFGPPLFSLITLSIPHLPGKFMRMLFLHPVYQTCNISRANKPFIW